MCGFVGWLDKSPADRATLERMTTTLAHRGPDAAGYHLEGAIGLGHRRLAVIDLAASQQPMLSHCGRYALAYNGELYNFKTLRAELQAKRDAKRAAAAEHDNHEKNVLEVFHVISLSFL